jgi:hypothetical protein
MQISCMVLKNRQAQAVLVPGSSERIVAGLTLAALAKA